MVRLLKALFFFVSSLKGQPKICIQYNRAEHYIFISEEPSFITIKCGMWGLYDNSIWAQNLYLACSSIRQTTNQGNDVARQEPECSVVVKDRICRMYYLGHLISLILKKIQLFYLYLVRRFYDHQTYFESKKLLWMHIA